MKRERIVEEIEFLAKTNPRRRTAGPVPEILPTALLPFKIFPLQNDCLHYGAAQEDPVDSTTCPPAKRLHRAR